MGLFSKLFGKSSKTTIREIDFASSFVMNLNISVKKEWPGIIKGWELQIPNDVALFEFFMAVLSTQILALPNFLPANQAIRMKDHFLRAISIPEFGTLPIDAFREYQNAWDSAEQKGELGADSIVNAVYDKLFNHLPFGSSFAITSFLSLYIANFCVLNKVITGYELVP